MKKILLLIAIAMLFATASSAKEPTYQTRTSTFVTRVLNYNSPPSEAEITFFPTPLGVAVAVQSSAARSGEYLYLAVMEFKNGRYDKVSTFLFSPIPPYVGERRMRTVAPLFREMASYRDGKFIFSHCSFILVSVRGSTDDALALARPAFECMWNWPYLSFPPERNAKNVIGDR